MIETRKVPKSMATPNPAANPAEGTPATSLASVNRRRSTRVWHETSLVVRLPMPDGSAIKLAGQTFAVNVHGGLLQLPAEVHPGQMMELTNPATEMVENCHVVRTEPATENYLKVAFEFERPAVHFWAIAHPPEDWEIWGKRPEPGSGLSGNPAAARSEVSATPLSRGRSTRIWHETPLVVRISTPTRGTIEHEGRTFAVNVYGGLLRLSVDVSPGQTIELMNPSTEMTVRCLVVRTERAAEGFLKVVFAFDQALPHFWAIAHPPEDWGIKKS